MHERLPKIIAHRGANRLAPENTLAAFKKAKEKGCHWVEFDVTLSSDEIPVVIHDDTLDRTTTGTGAVNAYPLQTLKSLDIACSKTGKHYSIPSLVEALECLQAHHMYANIELIYTPDSLHQNRRLAERTCEVLTAYPGIMNTGILSSLSPEILTRVRQILPQMRLAPIIDRTSPLAFKRQLTSLANLYDTLGGYSLHIHQDMVTPSTLPELLAISPRIICWTVNDARQAHDLFSLGVQSIISDDVLLLQP